MDRYRVDIDTLVASVYSLYFQTYDFAHVIVFNSIIARNRHTRGVIVQRFGAFYRPSNKSLFRVFSFGSTARRT